jgi:hypothetical protein
MGKIRYLRVPEYFGAKLRINAGLPEQFTILEQARSPSVLTAALCVG